MADTSLVWNLITKDKSSKTVGKVGKKFNALATGIVAGAAGIGVGLAKIGGDFAKTSKTIQVGTGATGEALEGLKKDFKEALKRTPADMQTVSAAMADLNTMTGATGKTLQDLTVGVTEASRLLGEDASANAKQFGQVLTQFQIPAEQGEQKLDKLFKATQDYGVGLGEITSQLTEFGPVLSNAGFNMEQSATLFGKLNKAGISVSRIMPGLNMGFRKWAEEGKNVQDELGKTVGKIQNAEDNTKALKIATEAFGAEGAQRMVKAVRSGAVSFDDLSGALDGAEGSISKTAEGTDTWREKLSKLKNEGLVAVEPAATAVFDALSDGVSILKSMVEWGQENTGAVKAMAIGIGALAAAIVTANVGIKIYNAAAAIQLGVTSANAAATKGNALAMTTYAVKLAVVKTATAVWTAVQWGLNAALSPMGLIILAIVAAVAALIIIGILVVKNWDTIVAALGAAWDWLFDKLKAFGSWFMETFWTNGLKKVIDALGAAWDWVVNKVQQVIQRWRDILGRGIAFVKSLPGKIQKGLRRLFEIMTTPHRKAINWVRDNIGNLIGAITSIPRKIGRGISRIFSIFVNPFKRAFNRVAGLWNRTIGSLSFTVPSWVPGLGGKGFSFPRLPMLAKGGVIQHGGMAIVGEQGPEVASLPAGARVSPLDRDGGGGPAILEIQSDGSELGELLLKLLRRSIRKRGGNVQVVLGRRGAAARGATA